MYACMYVCMYVCMYMYVGMYVCMYRRLTFSCQNFSYNKISFQIIFVLLNLIRNYFDLKFLRRINFECTFNCIEIKLVLKDC